MQQVLSAGDSGSSIPVPEAILSPMETPGPHLFPGKTGKSHPAANQYLALSRYYRTPFNGYQEGESPYGPPPGTRFIDPSTCPAVPAGLINILTPAASEQNYFWAVGSDRVSYVNATGYDWNVEAVLQALALATNESLPAIPDANFREFGRSSATGMNVSSMNSVLSGLFGDTYAQRFGNGMYAVVDSDNVLYTGYGGNLYAFGLADSSNPSAGIIIRHMLADPVTAIQGEDHPPNTEVCGLMMTYDGHILVTFTNGVAIMNRWFDTATAVFYPVPENESIRHPAIIDEYNDIYVASDSVMHKIVWTGLALSDAESYGAWLCPYAGGDLPPVNKAGPGTGSSPVLMGFGPDEDQLVVITDGQQHMHLLAFWRNTIPKGFRRLADSVPVTCGLDPLPEWIQSERSVVIHGTGAFVVNSVPGEIGSDLLGINRILQVSLIGPAYPASFGVERFEWNPVSHSWSSVWSRSDISCTSMNPLCYEPGNMVLVGGWSMNGWGVTGLDWDTGETVHETLFGDQNYGNGAGASLQYLPDQDLIFNAITGPVRVDYGI